MKNNMKIQWMIGLLVSSMLAGSFGFAQDATSGATHVRKAKKQTEAPVPPAPSASKVDTKAATDFDGMIRKLWNEIPVTDWEGRKPHLDKIIEAADQIPTTREYKQYMNLSTADSLSYYRNLDILRYNDDAFNKVLAEVKSSKVPEGEVYIWMVYNMGYVLKTAKVCFAMDLKHRRAKELIPYLDFATITHKHGDHYSDDFNEAMQQAGKPVLSNFIENGYLVKDGGEMQLSGVSIRTNYADHNVKLLKFVVVYEFELGKDVKKFTVVHSGDACNYEQIQPKRKADIFIYHMRVGLNLEKAHENVLPKISLLSHVLELGHPKGKARWTYDDALNKRNEISMKEVWVPIWGEKMVFKTK